MLLLLITQPSCILLSLIIRITSRLLIIGLCLWLRIIRTTRIYSWSSCCWSYISTSCCGCCCSSTRSLWSCSSLRYFDWFPLKNWSIHFWDYSPHFRWIIQFNKPKSSTLFCKRIDNNLRAYRWKESTFEVIQEHWLCHVRLQFPYI